MNRQLDKRDETLDIAKGIGILLVVLGHCPQVWNPLKQWIYAFHMPLFFLVAGMVWDRYTHEKRGFLTGSFLLKKAKRLLLPCFLWGVLYMLVGFVRARSITPMGFAYLIYGSQAGFSKADSLTSLWFLPCMFVSVCLFEGLQQAVHNKKGYTWILAALSIVFAAIGVLLPKLSGGYPWSIDVSMLALALMICGFLLKDKFRKLTQHFWTTLLTSLICLGILTATYRLNLDYISINNADMAGRYFGNPALYLLDALCGSLFALTASALLKTVKRVKPVLARMGSHTIPILLIHKPVVQILGKVFQKTGVTDFVAVVVEFVVAVLVSEGVYWLSVRRMPGIYGEDRRMRKAR